MCIEREEDNFKSREVNCLKECALALMTPWSGKDNSRLRFCKSHSPIIHDLAPFLLG